MDWRSANWWHMPGPSRFIDKAAERALGEPAGVVGLALPDPRPEGLLDALAVRIEAGSGALVTRVDARPGLRGRSAATMLAASAGIVARVRTIEDFVRSYELSGRIFLVDRIAREEWDAWAIFLTFLKAERARVGSLLAPGVVVAFPSGVPLEEYRSAVGTTLRWQGVVSRIDTELYAERECAWPDDGLLARTALSVIVGLAGWDPSMVRSLARLPPEEQLDPRLQVRAAAHVVGDRTASWSNGLVDLWDGVTFPHSLSGPGQAAERLEERIWRAHVRTVFPFLDQVRRAFAAKYEQPIRARLPLVKTFHTRQVTYGQPHELELHDINELLKGLLPRTESTLLGLCKYLRRQMAHGEPGDAPRIRLASELWEEIGPGFPDGAHAWEWPRCGQRLVLMVGPSGGGKTHWAGRNHDAAEVVSADAIRERLFGHGDMVENQEAIFVKLRHEVTSRLAAGRSVVIDATNIRREDRLANALLMPPDLPVEYVVIDRPMPEKEASSGRRGDHPGLLSDHAEIFAVGLADILAGDGLANVIVRDLRKAPH